MRAPEASVQPPPASADEAHQLRRTPYDEGVIRHVLGDDRARANHSVLPNPEAAKYRGVRSDRCTLHHLSGHDLPFGRDCAGVWVVGEARVGPYEDVVPDRHPVINRREVLYLAVVTDDDVLVNVDRLAQAAVPPDTRALAHLRLVPDVCVLADFRVLRDFRGAMYEDGHRLSEWSCQ